MEKVDDIRASGAPAGDGPIQWISERLWRDEVFPVLANAPIIPTGIPEVDRYVYLERGMLVGLLGYAKAGKSRLGRTIAYNCAARGLRVIHVTTEMRPTEEFRLYGVRHAWALDSERAAGLNISAASTASRSYSDKAGQPGVAASLKS